MSENSAGKRSGPEASAAEKAAKAMGQILGSARRPLAPEAGLTEASRAPGAVVPSPGTGPASGPADPAAPSANGAAAPPTGFAAPLTARLAAREADRVRYASGSGAMPSSAPLAEDKPVPHSETKPVPYSWSKPDPDSETKPAPLAGEEKAAEKEKALEVPPTHGAAPDAVAAGETRSASSGPGRPDAVVPSGDDVAPTRTALAGALLGRGSRKAADGIGAAEKRPAPAAGKAGRVQALLPTAGKAASVQALLPTAGQTATTEALLGTGAAVVNAADQTATDQGTTGKTTTTEALLGTGATITNAADQTATDQGTTGKTATGKKAAGKRATGRKAAAGKGASPRDRPVRHARAGRPTKAVLAASAFAGVALLLVPVIVILATRHSGGKPSAARAPARLSYASPGFIPAAQLTQGAARPGKAANQPSAQTPAATATGQAGRAAPTGTAAASAHGHGASQATGAPTAGGQSPAAQAASTASGAPSAAPTQGQAANVSPAASTSPAAAASTAAPASTAASASPSATTVSYSATAGPGCAAASGASYAMNDYYTEATAEDGWLSATIAGGPCGGLFYAIPMSGSATSDEDDGDYTTWTFSPPAYTACTVEVYIPDDSNQVYVGGDPAYYSIHDTDGTAIAGFNIDQPDELGQWVDVGQVTTGQPFYVRLDNTGQDWSSTTGDPDYAHDATAQVSVTCS